ncbi:MAG TPA: hypothetical protein VG994_02730 [Steroidobacteraceae bacterium]|nr:hypothetical protein [Steroidobacteraceae bacterium]
MPARDDIPLMHSMQIVRAPKRRSRRTFAGELGADRLLVRSGAWIVETDAEGAETRRHHRRDLALVLNPRDTVIAYPADAAREEMAVIRVLRVVADSFKEQRYAVETTAGIPFVGPCFVMRRHQ